MISEPFDTVEVPFPFTDLPRSKRRKAVVLSTKEFNEKNQNSVLMMITSATRSGWIQDVPIQDRASAGLNKPCVARMKIFTLDNRLLIRKAGALSSLDRKNLSKALRMALPALT